MMNFRAKDWNRIEIHRLVVFWQASYFGLRLGLDLTESIDTLTGIKKRDVQNEYDKISSELKNEIEKCREQKLSFTWIQPRIISQLLVHNLEGALLFCSQYFLVSFIALSFCIAFIRKFVVHLVNMCTVCRCFSQKLNKTIRSSA